MKHWTEPNGIFLIQIPIDWQYLNPAAKAKNTPPYSFQPYRGAIGCFQISCYPLEEEAPRLAEAYPNGVPSLTWKHSRMDDSKLCVHIFWGACADQVLIGKYIYDAFLNEEERIKKQLSLVDEAINSIVIVPPKDRRLASDLDKFDRFTGALAASYDLLDAAIESQSYIEIIALSANQIDAFLRLSIVISIQIKNRSDKIQVEYLFQKDNQRGMLERKIFDDALKNDVITESDHRQLNSLYKLRNRVIHRYVISDIKTRDLPNIAIKYLKTAEKMRLILRDLETKQHCGEYGVYGKKFAKASPTDDEAIRRLYADVNDKHLLHKFSRKVNHD